MDATNPHSSSCSSSSTLVPIYISTAASTVASTEHSWCSGTCCCSRRSCGANREISTTINDKRIVEEYSDRHGGYLTTYALFKLGVLEYLDLHSTFTKETWLPICTKSYLSVTLLPIKSSPGERRSPVRFFSAELEDFDKASLNITSSYKTRLEEDFPAIAISYKIVPASQSMFDSGFVRFYGYHRFSTNIHRIRECFSVNDGTQNTLIRDVKIQDVLRVIRYEEYCVENGLLATMDHANDETD